MRLATGGSPDTYPPFIWPFESPFLIFRYSWEYASIDENVLSLIGGLLLIGGILWGYLGFPPNKIERNKQSGRVV
jgi:hypothetical protein